MKKYFLVIFLSALTITSTNAESVVNNTQCTDITYFLRTGSSDRYTQGQVTKLQQFLVNNGFRNLSATGFFGSNTSKALKSFQAKNGISPSGMVGLVTQKFIKEKTCTNTSSISTPTPPLSVSSSTSTYKTTTPVFSNIIEATLAIVGKALGSLNRVVQYNVTYTNAQSILLNSSHVQLIGEGSAGCVVNVTAPPERADVRNITISGCKGVGPVSFIIKAGSAVDSQGLPSKAFGTSTVALISNPLEDVAISKVTRTFSSNGKNLEYDVYRPVDWNTRSKMPSLIWVHGGGWRGGDTTGDEVLARETAKLGATVFVPNYATATNPYAAMGDVDNFVKKITNEASEFNIDIAKISIGGGSAGGHLALNQVAKSGNNFNCAIGLAAPVDLFGLYADSLDYPLSSDLIKEVFGTDSTYLKSLSPVYTASMINRKTKIALLHETLDNIVPIKYTEKFVSAMKANNRDVDITENYHSEYNQYPIKARPEQATHVFSEIDTPELVRSYFYSKCMSPNSSVILPTTPLPTVSLSANGNPVANGGVITVTNGTVSLVWGSTGATSCTLNGVTVPSSGTQTFTGVISSSFTYRCSNTTGSTSLGFTTVVPATPLPTVSLSANGNPVANGGVIQVNNGTVSLVWGSTGATSCDLNGGTVPTSGVQTFTGVTSSSFIYRCTNASGSKSITFSTDVPALPYPDVISSVPLPTVSLSANGNPVANGGVITVTNGTVSLVWGSTGATSCTLNGVTVPSSGTQTFTGVISSSFTYRCSNTTGSTSLGFTTVVPATPLPTVSLSANGNPVANGGVIQVNNGTVSLVWGSTGATSCDLNGVTVPTSGVQTFTGVTSSSFIYRCTNASGSKSITFSTNASSSDIPTQVQAPSMSSLNFVTQTANSVRKDEVFTIKWAGIHTDYFEYNVNYGAVYSRLTGNSWTGSLASDSTINPGNTYTVGVRACNNSGVCSSTLYKSLSVTAQVLLSECTTAQSNRGSNGQSFDCKCSPDFAMGTIWGTGTYTDDSNICTAAMHAGSITRTTGGNVRYTVSAGQSSYLGTTNNGITSASYGAWEGSYVVGVSPISLQSGGELLVSKISKGLVLGKYVTCVSLTTNLHRGFESPQVKSLQTFLIQKGYLFDNVTGFYGDKTVQAVKGYQMSKGLPVTGMVYDFTRESIRAESCQ